MEDDIVILYLVKTHETAKVAHSNATKMVYKQETKPNLKTQHLKFIP